MPLDTHFLPAERRSIEEIIQQLHQYQSVPLANTIMNAFPDAFVVLNAERQAVFINEAMLSILGLESEAEGLGLRPGEILHCEHSTEETGGCGTAEACKYCGGVIAVHSSLQGRDRVEDFNITTLDGQALEFRVWARYLQFQGEVYSLVSIKDISDEKRRRALEQIFFHDVLNTAGAISAFTELMNDVSPDEADTFQKQIVMLTKRMVEDIRFQKQLADAEADELEVQFAEISAYHAIHDVYDQYAPFASQHDVLLEVVGNLERVILLSDESLLLRVIGNMVKNAIEASQPGDVVQLGYHLADDDKLVFVVKNPCFIPRRIQLQMFNRSFSSKGQGRGLGTYSMRLLTEKYLGGKISFTSDKTDGTAFFCTLPFITDVMLGSDAPT